MLAAPDVDFDVFRRQVAEIGPAASRFYVFVARDDGALAVSRRVWGDMPRLGAINPEASPYNELLEQDKIRWVDLTGVGSDDFLRHGTFASAPGVVRAIGVRLAGGQLLGDRAGVGQTIGQVTTGAVGAVGAAAGAAVSAPFVLVDPQSRESFGDNFERVGAGLGDALRAPIGK